MEYGGPMMPQYPQMPMHYPMNQQCCTVDYLRLCKAYEYSKKTTKMLQQMVQSCQCPPPPPPYDPCGCGPGGLCNTDSTPK